MDKVTHYGWSVVVHGTARDISAFDSPQRQGSVQAWAGHKDFLIRITPRKITGRRVAPLSQGI